MKTNELPYNITNPTKHASNPISTNHVQSRNYSLEYLVLTFDATKDKKTRLKKCIPFGKVPCIITRSLDTEAYVLPHTEGGTLYNSINEFYLKKFYP